MKIGELSKKSGCSIQTIRYYEREGLLLNPNRSEGNFRLYDSKALMCAELAGDFHLGDSRQLTDKSLLPFDLVS